MSTEPVTTAYKPRCRWYQFSLASLFVVLTVAAIGAAWYANSTRRLDSIHVHIGQSETSVDHRTAADFPLLLASRVERFRSTGLDPSSAKVVLGVADDATYGQFRQAMEECWDAGLRSFVLER